MPMFCEPWYSKGKAYIKGCLSESKETINVMIWFWVFNCQIFFYLDEEEGSYRYVWKYLSKLAVVCVGPCSYAHRVKKNVSVKLWINKEELGTNLCIFICSHGFCVSGWLWFTFVYFFYNCIVKVQILFYVMKNAC